MKRLVRAFFALTHNCKKWVSLFAQTVVDFHILYLYRPPYECICCCLFYRLGLLSTSLPLLLTQPSLVFVAIFIQSFSFLINCISFCVLCSMFVFNMCTKIWFVWLPSYALKSFLCIWMRMARWLSEKLFIQHISTQFWVN